MIGIYYRVSTEEQTLDMQENAIDEYLKEHIESMSGKIKVYKDMGMSGANNQRPAFKRLINDCEKGKIQTVLVYKLDRLTRDAVTAIRLVLRFDELDVKFVATSQPMFSHGTPFRHAIIAIFAELAQMEREMIVERVNAGIAAARKRGAVFGAPTKITPEVTEKIRSLKTKGLTYRQIRKEIKLSIGLIAKVLKS